MAKKAYIGVNGVARKIKKGYIGIENFTKRNLPAGYTQVEYIESTGSQYFDPELVINKTDSYEYILDALLTNDLYGGANGYLQFKSSLSGGKRVTIRVSYDGSTHVTTVYVDGVVSSTTDWTSSYSGENVKIGILRMGNAGNVWYTSDPQIGKVYSCQIKKNGSLVRDYVPATNASGTAGLHDMVNGKFYTNAGTGTFAVGPTYKGIARKIKKAYIGIGGVARPCWSGGKPAYYGTLSSIGQRMELAGLSFKNYALFAGGEGSVDVNYLIQSTVYTFNNSLTKGSAPALSVARAWMASATTLNHALFASGAGNGSSYDNLATVDAYDTSLVHSTPSTLSSGRKYAAGTSLGELALFGGGVYSFGSTNKLNHKTDVYDKSLTLTSVSALGTGRYNLAAATIGTHALFGGGQKTTSTKYNIVDAYDTSLTRTTVSSALSAAREQLSAESTGTHALFAGGVPSSDYSAVVDAYDKSLTRITADALSVARFDMASTSVEGYAFFAGGGSTQYVSYDAVDVYDESLTHTVQTALSVKRREFAGASVGNSAIFAGGHINASSSTVYATVDAYTVA